jgi:hypothetical protein
LIKEIVTTPAGRASAALVAVGLALGAPAAAGPKKPALPPAPPLEGDVGHLAVARVDVVLRANAALVTTDLSFTRGTRPAGGALDAFVAYGTPSMPRAFEAQLLAVEDGRFTAPLDARGKTVATQHATQSPPGTAVRLGPATAAGMAFRMPGDLLDEALDPSGLAVLRVRTIHALPEGPGARSVLVRISGRAALPLGTVSLRAEQGRLVDPAARLCPPGGTPTPLALTGQRALLPLMAPARAPRTATDELCVSATLAP